MILRGYVCSWRKIILERQVNPPYLFLIEEIKLANIFFKKHKNLNRSQLSSIKSIWHSHRNIVPPLLLAPLDHSKNEQKASTIKNEVKNHITERASIKYSSLIIYSSMSLKFVSRD